ncbi:MAG TPA: PAS domain S-box protein, partial [Bacteroidota bacterium]
MKKPLHVLIVEDSELDASLMSRQLKTGKYDLLTKRVETEAAYREALDSQPWDVILCDYRLSDFDGMAALHLYNERGLDIPFIMVSATMTEDLIVEAMRSGARDYVMKAHLNRLLPAIERELREAEVRRENVRTSQALRESESRYRSLFENMIEGYVYCRLIYEQNVPKDFVFIDVNARFEELTGLKNVAGKNVSDIIPGIQTTNPDLFATYGRVALTGKSEQLETYLAQLGTWYSISVYSPKQEHFVAVFENITERKNAEEMLNLLKISVDRASDAAYWLNPEGQFVYVNDSACRSLGYEKHELMKLKIYDVDVLSTPAGWDSLWKQFSENRTVQLESKHRRSDGSVFSVEIISTFVKYGEKQYICGFARDISERKKAEEALRESEGKYRLLAESSPEMIYLIGRDGRVTYVNGAAASQFRAHPRDLVGKRLSDLFPPDNASRNLETISKAIESKKPIFREVLQKFPTGEIWLDARLTPLLDDNGDVIGVLGLSSDITERKNAEKALRESEMKFRLLFDNMDEGFALNEVILDERGRAVDFRFLDVNRAYERHTGMKSGDLVGKTIREAMPLVDQSQIENYGKVALTGEPMAFEYFSKTFGRYLRVRSFSPQRGRFAAVFEDITERKQAEVALRESEQRFSKVFYASPVPASITRESDGRYVDVNESFLKRMGYDREEVIGRSALDIGFWAEPSD